MFYNSRYNFCFKTEEGTVLYNANTGATIKLSGPDADDLGQFLVGDRREIVGDEFDEITFRDFIKKGLIVEENRTELLEIRERFWSARGETPVVLTMTTTMNCNLGCYYCYEERSQAKLELKDTSSIIEHLTKIFKNNPKRSLHVDWYGGEPLLNINYLESASKAIQAFCTEQCINYHASIISNGTIWPTNINQFINEHKIRQVQISFDGLKENHNRRRKYRKEFLTDHDNSFDVIMNLVDKLLDIVTVDVRFNVDWKNKNDIDGFLDLIIDKGWFKKKYPAIFQPARISSYSEKSSFIGKKQLSLDEFDSIRARISDRLVNIGKVEESEVPDGFPFPKTYVCAALASDSFVVGADQLVYRCGLQVGEKNRAVAHLSNNSDQEFMDKAWWDMFDPTTITSCSTCSFLPVCFGGCPKKHLEKDINSLDEQSIYWRNNLAKKVTGYLHMQLIDPIKIPEELQFRGGY